MKSIENRETHITARLFIIACVVIVALGLGIPLTINSSWLSVETGTMNEPISQPRQTESKVPGSKLSRGFEKQDMLISYISKSLLRSNGRAIMRSAIGDFIFMKLDTRGAPDEVARRTVHELQNAYGTSGREALRRWVREIEIDVGDGQGAALLEWR